MTKSWQYNGAHSWREVLAWCSEYLGPDYTTNGHETIFFRTPSAELLFRLRWG
jgi:hypothetical protein